MAKNINSLKLSQKRTCNNCRARSLESCSLGKKTRTIQRQFGNFGGFPEVVPEEPCYKPTNYKQYIELRDILERELRRK